MTRSPSTQAAGRHRTGPARSFRQSICAGCGGEKFARQCRHSRAWRAHKVQTFEDLAEVDFDCPHGLQINALGIGDAACHHGDTGGTENNGGGTSVARPPSAGTNSRRAARPGAAVPHRGGCIYAERFVEGCCHSWKVKCARDGRIHRQGDCEMCGNVLPPEEMHLGAVVTACNEGDEVAATVESLLASVECARVSVILVDDGSTDGSCDGLAAEQVRVLRHGRPRGVGRSRNHGWRMAREMGCDVVSFHDAHMRFPLADDVRGRGGVLEQLAVRALRAGAVTASASHDLPSRGTLRGCWLHYHPDYGLQPKWQTERPPAEWWPVPCMMGACYVMGAGTAEAMAAPTGRLWEDVAGRWGFSEQALSVKAFLLGIPVLQSRDLATGHRYRSRNPVPDALRQTWRNITRCMAVLFGRYLFERRFRTWCERRLGASETKEIAEEAFAAAPESWPRDPAEVFTHLLGRGAPIARPHECHRWLPEVESACRELAARRPGGAGARVLQWRPGEATLLVRDLLPEAEVTAVELPGHRSDVWSAICRRERVRLVTTQLGPAYAEHPVTDGRYDLILVGGEMQEECRRAARRALRPGGKVLINPTADRDLIEHEELKRERRQRAEGPEPAEGAAATTQQQEAESFPASLHAPGMSKAGQQEAGSGMRRRRCSRLSVTVCLLNWMREENLGPVLDCLAAQTVPVRVLLWNNGRPLLFRHPDTDKPTPIDEHPLVQLAVRSAQNVRCWPRWLLASMAETEFVCSLDDDLALADERVLEDAVAACRAKVPDGIVGLFGWRAGGGRSYRDAEHVNGSRRDRRVDLVKGRFMLFRRALLERVPLAHPALRGREHLLGRCDDIYVSLCISRGRRGHHLVPGVLGWRWRELGRHRTSLAAQPGHYQERDRMVRALLDYYDAQRENRKEAPREVPDPVA
ncbi:MAG: glycosyltransferase family 2 protein [Candidatus Brocadiia bacterium]